MAVTHAATLVAALSVLLYAAHVNCMQTKFVGLAEPEGVGDAVVNIVNDSTFVVKGLSFSGAAPQVYWWGAKVANPDLLASTDEDTVNTAVMKALLSNGQRISPTHYDQPLKNADVVVKLSPGKSLTDYNVVSFWCEEIKGDLGHFVLPSMA